MKKNVYTLSGYVVDFNTQEHISFPVEITSSLTKLNELIKEFVTEELDNYDEDVDITRKDFGSNGFDYTLSISVEGRFFEILVQKH